MILAMETATAQLGVALLEDGVIRASIHVNRGNAHDELLAPLCAEILARADRSMADLRGLAVSAGPGSFTGLRIGMAVAKGMALALNIPIAVVPTHDAIAEGMAHSWPYRDTESFAVCIDAKRDDVYAATYRISGSGWTAEAPVRVLSAAALVGRLPEAAVIAGDGAAKVHALAAGTLRLHPEASAVFDARAVAWLGARMLAEGRAADPDTCEPLYVQDFEVKQGKNLLL